jgi:hypothetical protein
MESCRENLGAYFWAFCFLGSKPDTFIKSEQKKCDSSKFSEVV